MSAVLEPVRQVADEGVRVDVRAVVKRYGERQVLRHAQLQIEPGQFVAIVGRSGCGKSTLLRLVAGLESPSEGTLQVDGRNVDGLHDDTRIMFQEARLRILERVLQKPDADSTATDGGDAHRLDAQAHVLRWAI